MAGCSPTWTLPTTHSLLWQKQLEQQKLVEIAEMFVMSIWMVFTNLVLANHPLVVMVETGGTAEIGRIQKNGCGKYLDGFSPTWQKLLQ